ncbi:MAG: hypothetical protein ACMUIP_12860 [bacterium]
MPNSFHKTVCFWFMLFLLFSNSAFGNLLNTWKHLQSEHFRISYKEKNKDLALMALNIAEETANTIADYFEYDSNEQKISIVIKDTNDYINGSANRYNSLVVIECRKADMFMRGENQWLRTIISHELSHIYTLRVMQSSALVAFSLLNYSEPRGENIISIVDYQHNPLPIWFVEGIAQLGSYKFEAEYRDPFREMLLRDSFYNDRLLTIDEMSRFEGSSRESELAYNQGFDLLLYMINEYPHKPIKDFCHLIRKKNIEDAILSYYGITMEQLYEDWRETLKTRYTKKTQLIDGTPLFERKKRVMNSEAIAADYGKYVIANWRHDYNRYDLMIMSEDRKKIEKVIEDVGIVLKKDRTTNSVWFNKCVNSRLSSGRRYDIYRLNKEGKEERMTTGKRCIAFDVKDNHLMYAAYKNGKTTVFVKDLNESSSITPDETSDVTPQTLRIFDYSEGVYKISQITPESAVLSIGTGGRVSAGIVKKDSFRMLWENLDVDVIDCVYAESDRLLFVSTIDGTPQLYWCDLKNDCNTWFKITEVRGGVRYPNIDYHNNNAFVTCSVYEDGDFTLYKLNNPFSKDRPVDISNRTKPANVKSREETVMADRSETKEIASNMVAMPQYFIGFNRIRYRPFTDEIVDSKNQLVLGGTFLLKNAPGNFTSGFNMNINRLFGYKTVPEIYPSASVWSAIDFWKFSLKEEISYQKFFNEIDIIYKSSIGMYIAEMYENTEFKTSLQYNLFQDNILTAAYSYEYRTRESKYTLKDPMLAYRESGTGILKLDDGIIYKCDHWSFDWLHYTGRSKFDPGDLGYPSFKANAGIDLYNNRYPGFSSYEGSKFLYESCSVPRIHCGLAKNSVLFDSRMSINLITDGFSYFTERDSGKGPLFMYEILGHEDMISGYSYGSIYARQLLRASAEVRFNPFISIFNKTAWFERMSAGLKIEVGDIRYFDNKSDIIASAEGSIRHSFYYWPNRLSQVYLKGAVPLSKIENIDDYPSYSIYFGLIL